MSVLEAIALTLVAVTATAVVAVEDPVRQSMVASLLGLLLTATFFVLQAPDVALSMLGVSAVVVPALVLLALARIRDVVPQEDRGAPLEDG
jgi:energy-converting hydrogenase B subunit D